MKQTLQTYLANLVDRAEKLIEQEEYLMAKHILERILKAEKGPWIAYLMLGEVWYYLHDYKKAMFYLLKAKELPGLDADLLRDCEKLEGIITQQILQSRDAQSITDGDIIEE